MRTIFSLKNFYFHCHIALIPYLFHVFQGPVYLGSRFFKVQVFQGPGPEPGSRF